MTPPTEINIYETFTDYFIEITKRINNKAEVKNGINGAK